MIPVIYFSWSVFYMQIMNAIPSGISQSFTDTSSFTVFFHCFSQLLSNLFVRYKSHLFFSLFTSISRFNRVRQSPCFHCAKHMRISALPLSHTAPACPTHSAAHLVPFSQHSHRLFCSRSPAMKPATKLSPAPVESMALTGRAGIWKHSVSLQA